jgi:hypothetical protein
MGVFFYGAGGTLSTRHGYRIIETVLEGDLILKKTVFSREMKTRGDPVDDCR